MTTNPFTALDKLKPTINLNEAYDKELKAINERRMMVASWKNELKKIQKQRNKKRYNGRD
jgi:hypothetical protein